MDKKMNRSLSGLVLLSSVLLLAGCPAGDRLDQRYRAPEQPDVAMENHQLCFHIPHAADFQPVIFSLSLRGTPFPQRVVNQRPDIKVINSQLCMPLPSDIKHDKRQYIADFTLRSPSLERESEPSTRRFVTGIRINEDRIEKVKLEAREY